MAKKEKKRNIYIDFNEFLELARIYHDYCKHNNLDTDYNTNSENDNDILDIMFSRASKNL